MKRYLYSLFFIIFACSNQTQAQTLITGFGSTQLNPFNITPETGDFLSPWTGTQTTTSVSVSNVSNQSGGIAATLGTPIDIAGTMADLTLIGALSGTPPVDDHFQIVLYDTTLSNTLTYDFTWSAFNGGTQTVTSPLASTTGVFNGTVEYWGLNLFGTPGDTVSFTFKDLETSIAEAPEPSTYAMLGLGLGFLGLGLYRRKKLCLGIGNSKA